MQSSQSTPQEKQVANADKQEVGFIEKYAIAYYLPTFNLLIYALLICQFQKPFYSYAYALLLPFVGKFLPRDNYEITHSKFHNKYNYHAYPLAANLVGTWLFLAWCIIYIDLNIYSGAESLQLAALIGVGLGPSIDAAHELIHRPQKIFQKMGFLNMTIFLFNVYPTEHIYSHHKHVGTQLDFVTSPKNQMFYKYLVKIFYQAHKFVFNYSKAIFLECVVWMALYLASIFAYSYYQSRNIEIAFSKLAFYVGSCMIGYVVFEAVQYTEHYGLVFKNQEDKSIVQQRSSWNSELSLVLNWMIFRFQRHADHHLNAYKYYSTLILNKNMARSPFTFFEAAVLCLIPPLYIYLMNPYVQEHMQSKKLPEGHQLKIDLVRNAIALGAVGLVWRAYGETSW